MSLLGKTKAHVTSQLCIRKGWGWLFKEKIRNKKHAMPTQLAQERHRLIAERDQQLARLKVQAAEIIRAQDALSVLETAWRKRLTADCGDLNMAVLKYEGEIIRLALDHAGGSVVKAAQSLNVSYQALGYIIDTRQSGLTPFRSVKRSRKAA